MNIFAITVGDPCGIGPEVTLKALKREEKYRDSAILFGSIEVLNYYNDILDYGFEINKINNIDEFKKGYINVYDPNPITMDEIEIGQVSAVGGKCAFLNVKAAIEFALRNEVSSVVTAPLNKEAMHRAGYNYAGHTEIFGEFSHGDSYAMLLWSDKLKVIHATTHLSMMDACRNIKKQRIEEVIRLADKTMKKLGYKSPRIAVAGLNAHAGENGLFGFEEINEINPAVLQCKEEGINVEGAIAPDTVFLKAVKGQYDIVVAMYHDQGHIPLKLLDFHNGVNITVGLDIIRTSVDHGTAFDIAGKLIASEESMLKAIEIGMSL